jgi:HK97 family phage portal protein
MGLFDWLGPTGFGLSRSTAPLPARKQSPALNAVDFVPADASGTAVILNRLVQVPAPLDGLGAGRRSDHNSAVFACLQVIASSIGEPALCVYRVTPTGPVELEDSPLDDLLDRPNPHFALDSLLGYLGVCLHVDGNAYWRKLRAGDPETGNVVELWPISPSRISPWTRPGSDDFITSYRYYRATGRYEEISPTNIVHFRYGIDDADHRRGLAPLKRLWREISSDEQATRYADRLLANLAINGLTLAFDKDAPAITQAQADELKARISSAYGGDAVGATAVLSPGAQLTALGFSPEQMDLKTLHRVPEERISAVLGVPAIVAGLGSGLDHATYSNVEQAREAYTETKLLPLWKSLAAQLTTQLVPDFTADRTVMIAFDTSEVRALADDQNALAERLKTLVEAGIIDANEARAEIGLAPRSQETGARRQEPAAPRAAASRVVALDTSRRDHGVLRGAQGHRDTKAIEDLPSEYERMRSSDLPTWVEELTAFFALQQRRVVRRLRAGMDHASDLVPESEAALLAETLSPLQLDALDQVTRLVVAELGVAFDLDDAQTRQFLAAAGQNIGGITETTRSAVQAELVAGQQAGEGIPALARRLRDLPAFDQARATVVARTELGTSQQQAALSSYRASGVVVGVRVMDGDQDAICAAVDGRTYALGQEPPPLGHPNCTRSYLPITDAAELTRSA